MGVIAGTYYQVKNLSFKFARWQHEIVHIMAYKCE